MTYIHFTSFIKWRKTSKFKQGYPSKKCSYHCKNLRKQKTQPSWLVSSECRCWFAFHSLSKYHEHLEVALFPTWQTSSQIVPTRSVSAWLEARIIEPIAFFSLAYICLPINTATAKEKKNQFHKNIYKNIIFTFYQKRILRFSLLVILDEAHKHVHFTIPVKSCMKGGIRDEEGHKNAIRALMGIVKANISSFSLVKVFWLGDDRCLWTELLL